MLRSALAQAVKWRLLSANPADAVDLPKQSRNEICVLSADQTRDFLEAAANDRLGSLFALAALAAGVPPKIVSEMLGHASAAFTLDVYSHVLPHMQDSAVEKVEALLRQGKRK